MLVNIHGQMGIGGGSRPPMDYFGLTHRVKKKCLQNPFFGYN